MQNQTWIEKAVDPVAQLSLRCQGANPHPRRIQPRATHFSANHDTICFIEHYIKKHSPLNTTLKGYFVHPSATPSVIGLACIPCELPGVQTPWFCRCENCFRQANGCACSGALPDLIKYLTPNTRISVLVSVLIHCDYIFVGTNLDEPQDRKHIVLKDGRCPCCTWPH